jgi:hypothetical protein
MTCPYVIRSSFSPSFLVQSSIAYFLIPNAQLDIDAPRGQPPGTGDFSASLCFLQKFGVK